MNTERYHRIKIYCEKNQLFSKGDGVLLGVSGGADSVLLVHMMKKLAGEWNLKLAMAHINHGIRGTEADRDEAFCRNLSEGMEIPILVFHGDVPAMARQRHMSEEEAGRYYRYQCMEEARSQMGMDKIAVAHHRDDQAETVLFQMLRGSSLRGLGGMRPVRDKIVRPLLEIRRKEIEEELLLLGQKWCEDSTNQETCYSRNQLRHQVLPYLEQEVVSGATDHLAKTASQMREVFEFIEEETERAREKLVCLKGKKLELDVSGFIRLHPVLQKELTIQLLGEAAGSRKDITSRHVESFCVMAHGQTGKRISLPYGIIGGKDYGVLWIQKDSPLVMTQYKEKEEKEEVNQDSEMVWYPNQIEPKDYQLIDGAGETSHILLKKVSRKVAFEENGGEVPKNNCTKCFDYARIDSMLEFRHPREGDYFLLTQQGKRKKLSRFLIDQKIPLENRSRIWVLAMGQHVLWIPQLNRSSAGFYVNEDTTTVLYGTMIG